MKQRRIPGILIDHTTAGFSVAARVGLLLAAGFAAVSALGSDSRVVRVLARHHRRVRVVLWVVLAAWAVASLARVPLLDRPLPPDAVPPPLGLLALVGVALYGIAAVRYAELHRRLTVIGDTINLAARLQATAPPGEVVIGPTTREGLGDHATVVPPGATQLKGRREPVPIYRLVSVASSE